MDREAVTALVHSMVQARIVWSNDGILYFAPEGEAHFGR
jgi:hypothetical protein